MEHEPALPAWRKVLEAKIGDPQERQRIAEAVGVRPITLTRWSTTLVAPRLHHLQQLVTLLASTRKEKGALITLLQQEFPAFLAEEKALAEASSALGETGEELPSNIFYKQIVSAHATTPESMLQWTIGNSVLFQLQEMLDPDQDGIALTLVLCVPPPHASAPVQSLYEILGTGPWTRHVSQRLLFLGAESLAGYATSMGRPAVIQNLSAGSVVLPFRRAKDEESVAAYPIQQMGRVAGCLLLSATRTDFFTHHRLSLIQAYTDLLVLAFRERHFYPLHQVALRPMPSFAAQQPLIATFTSRMSTQLIHTLHAGQRLTREEVELRVIQQLETDLLTREDV